MSVNQAEMTFVNPLTGASWRGGAVTDTVGVPVPDHSHSGPGESTRLEIVTPRAGTVPMALAVGPDHPGPMDWSSGQAQSPVPIQFGRAALATPPVYVNVVKSSNSSDNDSSYDSETAAEPKTLDEIGRRFEKNCVFCDPVYS